MAKSPNILWIMTDQQRADALGCMSPWMRRIRAYSLNFTRGKCTVGK